MSTILKKEPGLIQYKATAGDGTADKPFGVPFTIYDVTLLSVYLTPAGTIADDLLNLLTYDTDYIAANYITGSSGYVQLLSSAYPDGADDGDIITIFFDVGSAVVIPQYPLCAASISSVDSVIPVLGAGCTWIKSNDGTKIFSQALPSTQSVDLPTVTNAAVRYRGVNGDTQSSNTSLTPIRIGQSSYYDNVSGINNLTIRGNITLTNGNSDPSAHTIIGENLIFPLGDVTTNSVSAHDISIEHQNVSGYQTRFLGSNKIRTLTENISYTLPPEQARVSGSLWANDGKGNTYWLPQAGITKVGTITSGAWNAGSVISTENVVANGDVVGKSGVFVPRNSGIEHGDNSVVANSLVMVSGSESQPSAITIRSPFDYEDRATYVLPPKKGKTGDALCIKDDSTAYTLLEWKALKQAWVRFHVINIGTITNYIPSVVITEPHNVEAVNRIDKGIFDITFIEVTEDIYGVKQPFFSSQYSYIWTATGYDSQPTSERGVFNILQYPASRSNGADPQPGSCRFSLYNVDNQLQDPFSPNLAEGQIHPDVCIMFTGN